MKKSDLFGERQKMRNFERTNEIRNFDFSTSTFFMKFSICFSKCFKKSKNFTAKICSCKYDFLNFPYFEAVETSPSPLVSTKMRL